MTKIFNKRIFPLTAALLCGCSLVSTETKYIVQPMVKNPTSIVICREKQCAPARLSMSREYIYNSLLQLLQNNKGTKALLCNADAASHVCTEEYVSMPIKVGITPAYMYIDDVKITDITVKKGKPLLDAVLNYNVTYNGQTPDCRPAKTSIFVESANSIMLQDSGYVCKMTAVGTSSVRTMFAIDYIDLDYGYIGGYYSIGLSGPANGGGTGYMMLRLQQNAYPLSPALESFAGYIKEDGSVMAPSSAARGAGNSQVNGYKPCDSKAASKFCHNEPALQKEVMVKTKPDMTLNTPATVKGKPVTKIVVEEPGKPSVSTAKVQIFPLYKKKTEKADDVQDVKVEPSDKLKETVAEQAK